MKIVFSIQYNTRFGESLLVHVTDSNTAKERVYGMNTVEGKSVMSGQPSLTVLNVTTPAPLRSQSMTIGQTSHTTLTYIARHSPTV